MDSGTIRTAHAFPIKTGTDSVPCGLERPKNGGNVTFLSYRTARERAEAILPQGLWALVDKRRDINEA